MSLTRSLYVVYTVCSAEPLTVQCLLLRARAQFYGLPASLPTVWWEEGELHLASRLHKREKERKNAHIIAFQQQRNARGNAEPCFELA